MTTTATTTAEPQGPGRHRGRRLAARAVTEVFAPTVVLAVAYVAVALGSADDLWHGLLWAAVAVVLGSAAPFGLVVLGVRRGRLTDHHVRVRRQRYVPMLIGLGFVVVSLVTLVALHASRALLVLFVLVVVAVVVATAITFWWQISVHTGVASIVAMVAAALWGSGWVAVGALAVAAVSWSRVELKAHTLAQVVAGAVVGAAIGAIAFALLP